MLSFEIHVFNATKRHFIKKLDPKGIDSEIITLRIKNVHARDNFDVSERQMKKIEVKCL